MSSLPPPTRSRARAGDAFLPHPRGATLYRRRAPLEGQDCVPRRRRGVHRHGALLQRRGRQGQVSTHTDTETDGNRKREQHRRLADCVLMRVAFLDWIQLFGRTCVAAFDD